jgi:hypothetical protein
VAYTAVSTVADGDDLLEDWGNDVAAFNADVIAKIDDQRNTWSSPIASGITVGNGTTAAYYTQMGVETKCYFKFTLGSTSAITGDIVLTLPANSAIQRLSGNGYFEDATGSRYLAHVAQINSNTQVIVRPVTTGSTYAEVATACSATVPFTWATSDIIVAQFWYYDA